MLQRLAFPVFMLADAESFAPYMMAHASLPDRTAWPLFYSKDAAEGFAVGIGAGSELQIYEFIAAAKLLHFMQRTRPKNLVEVWLDGEQRGTRATQFREQVQAAAFFQLLEGQAKEEQQYRSN